MARLPVSAGTGPDPELPEPVPTLISTIKIAPTVKAFAGGPGIPGWLYVLPNGDVLVAERKRPRDLRTSGIWGWF